jgi:hypothetical protein
MTTSFPLRLSAELYVMKQVKTWNCTDLHAKLRKSPPAAISRLELAIVIIIPIKFSMRVINSIFFFEIRPAKNELTNKPIRPPI